MRALMEFLSTGVRQEERLSKVTKSARTLTAPSWVTETAALAPAIRRTGLLAVQIQVKATSLHSTALTASASPASLAITPPGTFSATPFTTIIRTHFTAAVVSESHWLP